MPTPATRSARARIAPPISHGVRTRPRPCAEPPTVRRSSGAAGVGRAGIARDRRPDRVAGRGERDARARSRTAGPGAGSGPGRRDDQPEGPVGAGRADRLLTPSRAPAWRSAPATAAAAAGAGRPARGILQPGERRLVLGHRGEDRQAGRRRQGPGGRVAGHDREPLLVGQRVARQQPEVDPRRRDPRAVRQHDGDPRRRRHHGSGRRPR